MASNTENLNLLMKNPSTDGADTFNIQTMLNENWQKIDENAGTVAQTLANILKPTTPPLLGLPTSTTPDGMFQALANTGELHVWRKTVVTTEPIPEQPAGYNLDVKTNFLIGTPSRSSLEPYINVTYANTVSISNDGTVNISGDTDTISGWYPSNDSSPSYLKMRGKFIKITRFLYLDAPRTVDMDTVYYIPNDATATLPNYGSASGEFRIEMQKVTGYPYTPETPAGTTTTYPVSTNPNAYQEGTSAGTTIEYLGKLGDKARVQVVSYVGTGTYGKNNPCSITADFKIKAAIFLAGYHHGGANGVALIQAVIVGDVLTASYQQYMGVGNSSNNYAKKSSDGKTFSWYQTGSATNQLNYSGAKYWILVLG